MNVDSNFATYVKVLLIFTITVIFYLRQAYHSDFLIVKTSRQEFGLGSESGQLLVYVSNRKSFSENLIENAGPFEKISLIDTNYFEVSSFNSDTFMGYYFGISNIRDALGGYYQFGLPIWILGFFMSMAFFLFQCSPSRPTT